MHNRIYLNKNPDQNSESKETEFWYPAQKPTRVIMPTSYYSPKRLIYTLFKDWKIYVYTPCGILKYETDVEKTSGWSIKDKRPDKSGNWITYEYNEYHDPKYRIVKRNIYGQILWIHYVSVTVGSVIGIQNIDSEGNIYIFNPGIYMIDGKSGEKKWEASNNYAKPYSILSYPDYIFVFYRKWPKEYRIRKFEKDTGAEEWSRDYSTLDWENWGDFIHPAKGKDEEFYLEIHTYRDYTAIRRLAKHNFDGKRLWEKEIPMNQNEYVFYKPRASRKDGRVIYQKAGYVLECLDKSGAELYSYDVGQRLIIHYFDSRNRILIHKVGQYTGVFQSSILLSSNGTLEWTADISINNDYDWEIAETLPVYALGRDYGREADYNNHYFVEMPHKAEES